MDPESPVSIEASGTVIGLQGYFGDDLARNIGMSTTPLDPMDKNRYVYSVNATKTKYQMMGFLEGVQNVSLGKIDTAYAIDYSKKFPRTGGDTVGILLDSVTLAPVSGSKVDLKTINAATSYKAYF